MSIAPAIDVQRVEKAKVVSIAQAYPLSYSFVAGTYIHQLNEVNTIPHHLGHFKR